MVDIDIIGVASRLPAYEQNRGNNAIMHPMISRLSKISGDGDITTNLPLSDDFCKQYNIKKHPSKRKFTKGDDVRVIIKSASDYLKSKLYNFINDVFGKNINLLISNRRLERYNESQIIISFNGDTFPHNGNWLYILKHTLDILAASQFKCDIVEFAGSPGPYTNNFEYFVTKISYNKVDRITNREPVSTQLLQEVGIKTPIYDYACPAFLLPPCSKNRVESIFKSEDIPCDSSLIGVTLSGFNIPHKRSWANIPDTKGTELFVPAIKFLLESTDAHLVFLTHSYAWDPKNGLYVESGDYKTLVELYNNESLRDFQDEITVVEGLYSASQLKGMIGEFDLFLSGRLHAAAAGYSQGVPTALLAYGHKHYGFAQLYGQENYVSDGTTSDEIRDLVKNTWESKNDIAPALIDRHSKVVDLAEKNFELIDKLCDD